MNLHICGSLMSAVELEELSAAARQVITPKSSEANIRIVQDSVIGAYLMGLYDEMCNFDEFCQIMMCTNIGLDVIKLRMRQVKLYPINPVGGRSIISMLLPDTFCLEDGDVKIECGVFYEGLLTKSVINKKIIKFLHKEYGNAVAVDFIDNIQFVTNKWLESFGFSIGLKDCVANAYDKIDEVVNSALSEAWLHEQNTRDPVIREIKVNSCLSRAKDVGMKLARDAIDRDNNLVKCVKAGSKGDMFNIAQVIGIVGQQNVGGGRIKPQLSHGVRTLPHYHFDLKTDAERYESRGFIRNSFMKGINPREFFFHCVTGRSGVVDTAVGTSLSGYNSRKLVKLQEDIKVQYDGTVRDVYGNIIQYAYGLDPERGIKVGEGLKPFDIGRLAAKYQ